MYILVCILHVGNARMDEKGIEMRPYDKMRTCDEMYVWNRERMEQEGIEMCKCTQMMCD